MSLSRFLVGLIFCQFCAAAGLGELDLGFSTTPRLSDQQVEALTPEQRQKMICDYHKLYTIYYIAETKAVRDIDLKPLSDELFAAALKTCMSFTPEQTLTGMKDFNTPGGIERQNRICYDGLESLTMAWEQKTLGRVEAKRPIALISPRAIREEFAPGMPADSALKSIFPSQPTQNIQPLSAPKKALVLVKRADWDWKLLIGGAFLLVFIALFWFSRR